VFIWNIFSGFGIMNQEKSGNPGEKQKSFVGPIVLDNSAATWAQPFILSNFDLCCCCPSRQAFNSA
jgi:hypothetical protein